jgi:peptide/nickel transport system permease protein
VQGFLIRRVLQAVPTVLLIATVCFFLLRLAPGDVAEVIAGQSGAAPPGYVEELRVKFGLDRPLIEQYFLYMVNLVTGNLGFSFHHNMPVADLILSRLWPTLLLGASSLLLAAVLGIVLGSVAALNVGRWGDRAISFVSLVAYALPNFWLSLMLIVLFGVKLNLLPTGGMGIANAGDGAFATLATSLVHLILPATSLALFYLALYIRLSRVAILEVLRQDFVRTARSKGLSPTHVFRRHVLPNSVSPVLSMLGVQISGLFGGAVLVETVFGWPGLGRLAFEALLQRDFNLLLGILLLSSVLVVVVNILVDLVSIRIDPRVTYK